MIKRLIGFILTITVISGFNMLSAFAEDELLYLNCLVNEAFPDIYSRSEGLTYETLGAQNQYSAFAVAEGGQEVIYKTDGPVKWFYFQFMYNKNKLGDNNYLTANWNRHVKVAVSADGITYNDLTWDTDYKTHTNTTLKTTNDFSSDFQYNANTRYKDLNGARLSNNLSYAGTGSTVLSPDIRYIRLQLTHNDPDMDVMYLVEGFVCYTLAYPSATILKGFEHPLDDCFYVAFDQEMDDSTINAGAITVEAEADRKTVTKVEKEGGLYKVCLNSKLKADSIYTVTFSDTVVNQSGLAVSSNELKLYTISEAKKQGDYAFLEKAVNFSKVYEKSDNITIVTNMTANTDLLKAFPSSFLFPAGDSFITYEFEGKINWFYFQFFKNNLSALNSYLEVYVSKDGKTFDKLEASVDYQRSGDTTLRTPTKIEPSKFEYTDTTGTGFRLHNYKGLGTWTTLNEGYRYLKIELKSLPANSLYLIDSSASYTVLAPAVKIANSGMTVIDGRQRSYIDLIFSNKMNMNTVNADKFSLKSNSQDIYSFKNTNNAGTCYSLVFEGILNFDTDYTLEIDSGMKTQAEELLTTKEIKFTTNKAPERAAIKSYTFKSGTQEGVLKNGIVISDVTIDNIYADGEPDQTVTVVVAYYEKSKLLGLTASKRGVLVGDLEAYNLEFNLQAENESDVYAEIFVINDIKNMGSLCGSVIFSQE